MSVILTFLRNSPGVADLDSRELLLAVGWFIAETKLLEQWVTEGSLSLWYDDGGTERLLTHYDDDVGLPVVTTVRDGPDATTSTTAVSGKGSSSGVKRSTESLPSSSTSLTTTSPASSSSALDLLSGHVYRVGRANGAVRALCGELAGRLREADRLRAADPALTPAQRLLLRSSRQQEQYAARLADANERLGRALAAEEAHHPAWWQWLATAAVDANSGVSKDDDKDSSDRERHDTDDFSSGEVAGARREFFATLAPLRDTLMLARRKWTRARQQLRSEIVRAERALAKAEMAVYDAVATGCTRCRRADGNDSRDGTVPNVLCVCAFAARPGERPPTDAVGGGGAGLVGLRRTFCVGTGARAPRGAISVAAEAERARVDFDNICAELATAAKANADLLQILLTKAPSLVLVK